MSQMTWSDVEAILSPDRLPELESWRKSLILAQVNRYAAEFGPEFCTQCRNVLVSQLARKSVFLKPNH